MCLSGPVLHRAAYIYCAESPAHCVSVGVKFLFNPSFLLNLSLALDSGSSTKAVPPCQCTLPTDKSHPTQSTLYYLASCWEARLASSLADALCRLCSLNHTSAFSTSGEVARDRWTRLVPNFLSHCKPFDEVIFK